MSDIVLDKGNSRLPPIIIKTHTVVLTNHRFVHGKTGQHNISRSIPSTVEITLPRVDALKNPPGGKS